MKQNQMDKKYYYIGGGLLVLLILGVTFLFANNDSKPKSKGKVELVWWKTFEDSQNIQDMIADFTNLNPNVTIKFIKKDINSYEQELLDALAAGRGPDIFSIHNDWLPKHIDKLLPASDKLISQRLYKDTFVDVVFNDFVGDGKIYAMPMSLDVLALYYNKDLLGSSGISQPPKNWDELVRDVQKLTLIEKSGEFIHSGVALGTSSNINRAVDVLLLMMLQNGTKFYDAANTSAAFDQNQNIGTESINPGSAALEFYTQFSNPAKTSYTWNSKSDFSIDAFTQGKVAMILSYAYMLPVVKDKAPNLNWDVTAVPQIAESTIKVNIANYWAEAVSKSSKNPTEAWQFLTFLMQKDTQKKYYEKHKLISGRRDILAEQAKDTEIGVFAESALTAKSVYKKDASVFEGIFSRMIDDVVLRNTRPEDAIRAAVQQVNLSLRK